HALSVPQSAAPRPTSHGPEFTPRPRRSFGFILSSTIRKRARSGSGEPFIPGATENHPDANEHDGGAKKRPKRKLFSAQRPTKHDRAWWRDQRDRLQIRHRHARQQPIEQQKSERRSDDCQIQQTKDGHFGPMKARRVPVDDESEQEQRHNAEKHL